MRLLSIFYMCFSLLSTNAEALTIVSDLDDTIIISNSGDLIDGARRALAPRNFFWKGEDFLKHYEKEAISLVVVSASPRLFLTRAKADLERYGVRPKKLFLRPLLKYPKKFKFKVDSISEVLDESKDEVILIGDDVGEDPEVYAEIAARYPAQVLAIYIHQIEGRMIPVGQISYWTWLEVAWHEWTMNRWSDEALADYTRAWKKPLPAKILFPNFAKCPKVMSDFTVNPGIPEFDYLMFTESWIKFCKQR